MAHTHTHTQSHTHTHTYVQYTPIHTFIRRLRNSRPHFHAPLIHAKSHRRRRRRRHCRLRLSHICLLAASDSWQVAHCHLSHCLHLAGCETAIRSLHHTPTNLLLVHTWRKKEKKKKNE
ncbi:hypothetical protein K504DRAFT_66750 [Pleomassaria siparia CBS 279.74]|uniref:Uncharacterized protein n=1 Tax=Pleomassaria siparia CBS 279.74 TaxID=1314801 RepID=A0A6G1K2W7_9PLEO|nr:hypothetical protein K504DRAFT_66750 [Pleomassaria siparia CBS 279.74]